MAEKQYFVFVTTCGVTRQHFIGHTTQPDFIGAGRVIRESLKRYGRKEHTTIYEPANSATAARERVKELKRFLGVSMNLTMSDATKDKIRTARSRATPGCAPTETKTWILLSPDGGLVRCTKLSLLCAARGLSYSALRNKAQTRDQRPIARGPSTRWCVLAYSTRSGRIDVD